MIKILHIVHRMNQGGVETFIMNVYRKIDRKKIQFDFVCTSKEKGIYDDEIYSLGGHIYYIDNFSQKKIINTISKTRKIIDKYGPYEAIHIPVLFYSGIFTIAAKKSKIKKIIVHAHSTSGGKNNNILRSIYEKSMRCLINKNATHKLACGTEAGKFLFGNLKNVEIVYNGIDLKKFYDVDEKKVQQLKAKFQIDKELIIGHVGRFSKVKNHSFFIKIAQALKERNINFKIVLVGDGDTFKEVLEMVKENGLEKHFIFPGVQKETQYYYSMFDIFVMPSYYEGFPVSIIEALSTGTPCVLSSTITREVNIIDNSCTFINLNDDINLWCDAIIGKSKISLKNEKNIEKLAMNGFTIESTVDKLEKIYLNGVMQND